MEGQGSRSGKGPCSVCFGFFLCVSAACPSVSVSVSFLAYSEASLAVLSRWSDVSGLVI